MKVLLIHGRCQQGKSPLELKKQWVSSLEIGYNEAEIEFPANFEFIFPYFGDLLEKMVAELKSENLSAGTPKGFRDNSEIRKEIFLEMIQNSCDSNNSFAPKVESAMKEGCFVTEGTGGKGPLNWKWVQGLLGVLDQTPLGALAVERFTNDVAIYLTNFRVQKTINDFVSRHIPDEPHITIGHSLGSIIGYNVIGGDENPNAYITVGSPLGLDSIKRHLPPPLSMPDKTIHWFNGADPRDVVALNSLDTHFPIDPAITDRSDVENSSENFHGIGGYLSSPIVARGINDCILKLR